MLRSARRAGLLLVTLILFMVAAPGGAIVESQATTPTAAVQSAVAALERGYTAAFARNGGASNQGEARYESPSRYSLLVVEQSGAGVEYIVLDPDLYLRRTLADEQGGWTEWTRQLWHPDAPVNSVEGLHPRMPMELLAKMVNPRDAGAGSVNGRPARRIEGETSFLGAFLAAYSDSPNVYQDRLARELWPLHVWLDATTGAPLRIEALFEEGNALGFVPGSLEYTFEPDGAPVRLQAPQQSREVESNLRVRPLRDAPVANVPIEMQGSGTLISTPRFVSPTGSFTIEVEPAVSRMEYQVWRVKRGRQLIASYGSVLGRDAIASLPVNLAPGEYVVDVILPEDATWTLRIIPVDSPTVDASYTTPEIP